MVDGKSATEDGADGLTAAALKAKEFEAERQRMKEEWKREQAQKADAVNQVPHLAAQQSLVVLLAPKFTLLQ